MKPDTPVRRRYLIQELKRLRTQRGISQDQVSNQMGWDRGKIHRIENGRLQRIKASDVIALCDFYGASPEETETLATIARNSRQKGWWFQYQDVLPGPFLGLEAEAVEISEFSAAIIPGLFQTEDYINSLMDSSIGVAIAPEEKRARVEARLKRQESVLGRAEPPLLWTIIDEAALRRQVGGAQVMKAQIQHLVELSQRPNINIQVLPFAVGAHAAAGLQFTILGFSATDSVVYIETDQDGLYLEEHEQIGRYKLIFDRLQASAVSVERSVAFLAAMT
jgi:Predicted transcriptional regulators